MNDQRPPHPKRPEAMPGVTGNTDVCLILGDLVEQARAGAPAASRTQKWPHASA